ncbi:MAG TPA: SEL1-like repeat protein [Candidatus Rubneribacter avistercoris]|nr:SEL1-like repeat protein [Candidatus Rubneribacter avistercoris]
MATFKEAEGEEWGKVSAGGIDFFSGRYGEVCMVSRGNLALIAKGLKRFDGEDSEAAKRRRDREYDRIFALRGLEGHAPYVYGKGVLEVNGATYPAFLMTCVEGRGLGDAIRVLAGSDDALLSAVDVLRLAEKMAEAFAAMERAGVVHGDLHTDNVRVAFDESGGERPRVKNVSLIDFGNARRSDTAGRSMYTPTPADRRRMLGSFRFESPESFSCADYKHRDEGRSKPSSNMWAFGALLYYAHCRQLPHDDAAKVYDNARHSESASERAAALKAFLEAKLVPLDLSKNPDDGDRDFSLLLSIVRNTMVDDPAKRWTARRCMGEIEAHFDSPTPSVEAMAGRLRTMADEGVSSAQYRLGRLHERGLGVRQDYAEAAKLYEEAGRQGLLPARNDLGRLCEEGLGVEQDCDRAMRLYAQSAEQGLASAQCNLGRLHEEGRLVKRDYALAIKQYEEAAAHRCGEAESRLGNLYFHGHGVERSYERAFELFQSAVAKEDVPEAWYRLSYLYKYGLGVERDYDKAEQCEELWKIASRRC